jgi:hypothetical protein
MSDLKTPVRPAAGYNRDFFAWTQEQAARLREMRPNSLDWENVAEEIESLGRSDKRAIASDLKVVLLHLIKWRYQAERRSESWRQSIDEHRDRLRDLLAESPSLGGVPAEELSRQYARARRAALSEMGKDGAEAPEGCPFTIAQVLAPDFWPESSVG